MCFSVHTRQRMRHQLNIFKSCERLLLYCAVLGLYTLINRPKTQLNAARDKLDNSNKILGCYERLRLKHCSPPKWNPFAPHGSEEAHLPPLFLLTTTFKSYSRCNYTTYGLPELEYYSRLLISNINEIHQAESK